jgi:hypothetical protein
MVRLELSNQDKPENQSLLVLMEVQIPFCTQLLTPNGGNSSSSTTVTSLTLKTVRYSLLLTERISRETQFKLKAREFGIEEKIQHNNGELSTVT